MEKQELTVMEQFITLSHLLMYRHHHGKENHGHSLYRGQGRILSLLKIEPKMSQKKLSFLLGIRPQSMGELLVKLEQNGDITRFQSEEDRRSLDIELTEQGMAAAIANEQNQTCEQSTEEVFKCLSEEEQQNLVNYMGRVIGLLRAEMPEDQEALFHSHHHGHGDHCGHGDHHEHGSHCGHGNHHEHGNTCSHGDHDEHGSTCERGDHDKHGDTCEHGDHDKHGDACGHGGHHKHGDHHGQCCSHGLKKN